jgi:uncharacterized protein (TIGR02118 family)
MVKPVALYRKPSDMESFEPHYHGAHLPLNRQTPCMRKLEITHITGSPVGESTVHLIAEAYCDSMEALNRANASPESRAAAGELMSCAADVVTAFFGKIQE